MTEKRDQTALVATVWRLIYGIQHLSHTVFQYFIL